MKCPLIEILFKAVEKNIDFIGFQRCYKQN